MERPARLVAVAALVLVAAAAVAIVLATRSGGGPAPEATVAATPTVHHHPAWHLPDPPADVAGAPARRMAVPILMYHVVTAAPPGAPYPGLWVSRERFAEEMHALQDAGYYAVTLARVFAAWRTGAALPRHPIVLTFDDGYPSDARNARPVLRRLGWPGTLDLELHDLGPGGISVHQVRQLLAAGWELASHTLTHPDLTLVDDTQLRSELAGSRAELRRRFGRHTARFFCYPAGRYDARVVAAVRAAGYLGATTEDPGYATAAEAFTLRRVRVDGSDTAATLLARLRAEAPTA